jgi:trans-aconitate methyltransferase
VTNSVHHWDEIFATKSSSDMSWFQVRPTNSIALLRKWAMPTMSIIDVGAGTSTLVDNLLVEGWRDVSLLDVSAEALDRDRARLGDTTGRLSFIEADICSWHPSRTYDVWHDRAVFHFLVEPDSRDHYVALAADTVKPGGLMVLTVFAPEGPTTCSGLPTARYSASELAALFEEAFSYEDSGVEEHVTPFDTSQSFTWIVLRRK